MRFRVIECLRERNTGVREKMNEDTVKNNQREVTLLAGVFLGILLAYFLVSGLQVLLATKGIEMSLVMSIALSELIILLPCLIYILVGNINPIELLNLKRVKVGTVLLSILAAILFTPLAIFLNVLSQLFVPNEAQEILFRFESNGSGLLLVIGGGVIAPLCEELAFRGVFANRYRKFVSPIVAIFISALFFGLVHMNFNQCLYAIALGVIFAVVNVASGSLCTSMIMHVSVNVLNIIPALLVSRELELDAKMAEELTQSITGGPMMIFILIFYFGAAAVASTLGGLVIYAISKVEGRTAELKDIFSRHEKSRIHPILNVCAIISICMALAVMVGIELV